MTRKLKHLLTITFSCCLWIYSGIAAEALDITFQTSEVGGEWAPANIVVVWVQHENGKFVKTISRWASTRVYDFNYWWGASEADTDAVMGATRTNHSSVENISWDFTDRNGSLVPDGNYLIYFEQSDTSWTSHYSDNLNSVNTGLTSVPFTKDGNSANHNNFSATYFPDIDLAYTGRDSNNYAPGVLIPDQSIEVYQTAFLTPIVTDDGLPGSGLTYSWSAISGPGSVTFHDSSIKNARADFSTAGIYELQLNVSDGSTSTQANCKVYVSTIFIKPIEDANTRSSQGDQNFGYQHSHPLHIYGSNFNSYFKFNLNSIPGPVSSANFQIMQLTNVTNKTRAVYSSADDSWTEDTITWNNYPATGTLLASLTLKDKAFTSFNVTSFISTERNGDGIATIRMKGGATYAEFSSKEGAISPNLMVIYTVSNNRPTANAGSNLIANIGDTVTLNATGSTDSDGSISAYSWTQTVGTAVTLSADNISTPSFAVTSAMAGETLTFELMVSDNCGSVGFDTVDVFINSNALPSANAGTDQIVNENTTVTLNATGSSDSDGTISSYAWTQTVGTTVALSDNTLASPTFTAPGVNPIGETLTFSLSITDNLGAKNTDTVNITIQDINIAPNANAGGDQMVNEGTLVNLDGTGSSDTDGTIQSYTWTQISGTSVTLSDNTATQPTFTAPTVTSLGETLAFKLTIVDNAGDASTDTVNVSILNVNIQPTANAGADQNVDEGILVSLNASASSDSDGTISSYVWTQTAGIAVTLSSNIVITPNFMAPNVSPSGNTLTFLLSVTDELGSTQSDFVNINILNVNIVPIANAGVDQNVNENTTVTLNATGSSDSDGTISSYAWIQIVGTAVALSDNTQASPTFTAPGVNPSGEILTFSLTITDNFGAINTDTVNITIQDINIAPNANAGGDQTVNEGTMVTLDGTGSLDTDGTIQSYTWTQISGTSVTLSDSTVVQPSFTAPTVNPIGEILTFRLNIIDNAGDLSSDNVIISVQNVNIQPTANAGVDQNINEGMSVTLDASVSTDSDGSIASYSWTQTAGRIVTLSDNNAITPSFTAPSVSPTGDTLIFSLSVTDDLGSTQSDVVNINIINVNVLPSANAGIDQIVNENTMVTLDASASSDSDGNISIYLWTQITGTTVTLSSNTVSSPTYTSPSVTPAGETMTFRLNVVDDAGGSASDNVMITVNNVNIVPIANAGLDQNVNMSTLVTLDATGSSDADGNIVSYQWIQTAGSAISLSDNLVAQSTFTTPIVTLGGEVFKFKLIITDDLAGVAYDTININVLNNNQAPSANAGNDQYISIGEVVILDASTSSDPESNALTYYWEQISGTPVIISDNTGIKPTFTAPNATGTLVFELTVSDGFLSQSDAVSYIYNLIPHASAGVDQIINEKTLVTLDGNGSFDSDGTISNYNWTQLSGTSVTLNSTTIVNPVFTSPEVLPVGETIRFRLTVIDNLGGSQSDDIDIIVNNVNNSPQLNLSVSSNVLLIGEYVSGNIIATDSDGEILTLTLTANGNVITTTSAANIFTFSYSSNQEGNVLISATVSDGIDSISTSTNLTFIFPKITSLLIAQSQLRKNVKATVNMILSSHPSPESVSFQWYQNNTPISGANGLLSNTQAIDGVSLSLDISHFSELKKGDSIYVVATPISGGNLYTAKTSDVKMIINSMPNAPTQIEFSPLNPKSQDDITITITGMNDLDEDPLTPYVTWNKNGQRQVLLDDTLRVDANLTNFGELWTASVFVSDGEDTSNTFLASVNIGISPPTARAFVNSTQIYAKTEVIINASNSYGIDGSIIQYQFDYNSDGIIDYSEAPSNAPDGYFDGITTTLLDKGLYTIKVIVTDELGNTDQTFVDVTVLNSLPQITNLNFYSNQPTTEIDLSIGFDSADDDGDDLTYRYAWLVDGVILPLEEKNSLNHQLFNKNQDVEVQITPNDGENDGLTQSANIFIYNALPNKPVVSLSPTSPIISQDLVAQINEITDPDGDALQITYRWSKNGVEQSTTGNTIVSSLLENGQSWTVIVIASDGFGTIESTPTTSKIGNASPMISNVSITPQSPEPQKPVLIEVFATDTDGKIVLYEFDFDLDGIYELNSTTSSLKHIFPKGIYNYRIRAMDNEGSSAYWTSSTPMTIPNSPPIANAGIDIITWSSQVTAFNGTMSDIDGDLLDVHWIQISGPTQVLKNAQSLTPYFRPTTQGQYIFQLTVSDGSESVQDLVNVSVKDVFSPLPTILEIPNQNELQLLESTRYVDTKNSDAISQATSDLQTLSKLQLNVSQKKEILFTLNRFSISNSNLFNDLQTNQHLNAIDNLIDSEFLSSGNMLDENLEDLFIFSLDQLILRRDLSDIQIGKSLELISLLRSQSVLIRSNNTNDQLNSISEMSKNLVAKAAKLLSSSSNIKIDDDSINFDQDSISISTFRVNFSDIDHVDSDQILWSEGLRGQRIGIHKNQFSGNKIVSLVEYQFNPHVNNSMLPLAPIYSFEVFDEDSGEVIPLNNLTEDILITLPIPQEVISLNLKPMYFDEVTQLWSDAGITQINILEDHTSLSFYVNHLTDFSIFSTSEISTTTTSGGGCLLK